MSRPSGMKNLRFGSDSTDSRLRLYSLYGILCNSSAIRLNCSWLLDKRMFHGVYWKVME